MLRDTQGDATGFTVIGQVLLGMRQRGLAFWTICNDLRSAFAAKFGRSRAVIAVITAGTQTVQSDSHLFLLHGLPAPFSHTLDALIK